MVFEGIEGERQNRLVLALLFEIQLEFFVENHFIFFLGDVFYEAIKSFAELVADAIKAFESLFDETELIS